MLHHVVDFVELCARLAQLGKSIRGGDAGVGESQVPNQSQDLGRNCHDVLIAVQFGSEHFVYEAYAVDVILRFYLVSERFPSDPDDEDLESFSCNAHRDSFRRDCSHHKPSAPTQCIQVQVSNFDIKRRDLLRDQWKVRTRKSTCCRDEDLKGTFGTAGSLLQSDMRTDLLRATSLH